MIPVAGITRRTRVIEGASAISVPIADLIADGVPVILRGIASHLPLVAVGLEGAARFADMARACSGCDVWQQDFSQLDLPDQHFDGIFANASLFHLPSQALPRMLQALHASLKTGGVLFSSNPHGQNEEGWFGGRYGAFYDLETWHRHLSGAGFVELTHYYRPEGVPRHQQPWLASVWRKPGG